MSIRALLAILIFTLPQLCANATQQEPDILYYEKNKLDLKVGWGHPSPLETYFQAKQIRSPFNGTSTANYRDHIAKWVITDQVLTLKAINPPFSNYDENIKGDLPSKFDIYSKQTSANDGSIIADWFSGVIEAFDKEVFKTIFFHIRNGVVIDSGEHLADLNRKYIAYYFRIDDDNIEIDGKTSRLEASADRLSPFFIYFNKNHLHWPYNWESKSKTGAPQVTWSIVNDTFYVKKLQLKSGLNLYSANLEEIPLQSIFPKTPENEMVKASWVKGVFLLKHGISKQKTYKWSEKVQNKFVVKSIQLIRVKNGKIVEVRDTNLNDLHSEKPETSDKVLLKLISDYRGFKAQ